MNLLLVIPGLGFVFLQALGIDRSVTQALIIAQSQSVFAYQFVRMNWRSYVGNAFQLNRQFLYKWTVNWRFVPESTFLSAPFALGLLAAHVSLLLIFAFTRWTAPSKRSLPDTLRLFLATYPLGESDLTDAISARVSPTFIMTTLLTSNAIGMLCARSLHYQFYAWAAWATPFLLWRAGMHPVLIYGTWAAQEWAWNVYPSTPESSMVAVGALVVTVAGVWWGTGSEGLTDVTEKGKKEA
jgi:alpha-1,3-mannosyltransferase